MADLKQVFSEEIRRLARKEIRAELLPVLQNLAAVKKTVAEQKKQIAALQKNLDALMPAAPASAAPAPLPEGRKLRLNASGIIRIRKKLKLTQAEFAAMLGVAMHTVSMWEIGKVAPRQAMKVRICALRSIGKKELKLRLSELKKQEPAQEAAQLQK